MRVAVWINNIHDLDELDRLHVYCRRQGHEVHAVVHDAEGIADAARMYVDGDIGALVIVSRKCLPLPLEIITVEVVTTFPTQRRRSGQMQGHRPRRLR
jgi:hypothetical protein